MLRPGKITDNRDEDSLAARMRRKRFELFLALLKTVPKPVNILDMGGTQRFWEVMDFTNEPDVFITLLNLTPPTVLYRNFLGVQGNALDLSRFREKEFDIVFSNSVIEHVGNYDNQRKMAQEVHRIGKRYFVQTPNYYFPIEPHFLFPGFQWMPIRLRILLIRHFKLGWVDKISDYDKAKELIQNTRLLTRKALTTLFPNASLYEEKIFGLVKSFVVYDGWQT